MYKLNYEKILTPHTHTYTNTVKRRENKEKATLVHSTTAIWLSCSSFAPSRLDFSAGRRVHERAREILSCSYMRWLRVHAALRSARLPNYVPAVQSA